MRHSIARTLKLTASAALAAFAFTGCMTQATTDYTPDGGNVVISQESSNMGQVLNSSSLHKDGEGGSDTGEQALSNHSAFLDTATCVDSSGQSHRCFVRVVNFVSADTTNVRERMDTLWLLDSNGAYMTSFHPFLATTIIHHRHVIKVRGAQNLDIQFNTTLTKKTDSTGKVLVWNGTITGMINGVAVNATIDNVTRSISGASCGLPEDGSIHMDRNGVKIDLNFKGAGKADVVVTGKKGKQHHGTLDGGTETQKD